MAVSGIHPEPQRNPSRVSVDRKTEGLYESIGLEDKMIGVGKKVACWQLATLTPIPLHPMYSRLRCLLPQSRDGSMRRYGVGLVAGLAALSGVAGGRARAVKYAGRAGPLYLFNRREDVSM